MEHRLTVYVAASSKELERAEKAMKFIRSHDCLELASDWASTIRAVGAANKGVPGFTAYHAAQEAMERVERCDILWLLIPETPSFGAGYEMGYFMRRPAWRPLIISGGPRDASIFQTVASAWYATDQEAEHDILSHGEASRKP